jgi:hypothetical protein
MTNLLSPLLQWIIATYFIVNLMVLGGLLTVRLALTTVQAVGELKKQREEIRQQYVLIPRSPSGRHDRIRRQQKR